MKIKKHICFRVDEAKKLVEYLEDNGINYERGEIISTVDLYQSSPHWFCISEYVKQCGLPCLSETEFTKQELSSAEWLRIRSQWRFGYPQPEDDFSYEKITYTRQHYCPECSSGLFQVNPFRIKKVPKWGRRHFAELNWVGDELFLSDTARSVLEQQGITGISFMDVQNKSGSESFSDISQLVVHNTTKAGLIEDSVSIRQTNICPQCGVKKYLLSGIGMLSFRKQIFENQPDIVKTGELFGSDHYTARIIFVRQKVYQTIIQNNLDKGLVFEPIELEERQGTVLCLD